MTVAVPVSPLLSVAVTVIVCVASATVGIADTVNTPVDAAIDTPV